jgi:hypothetical protein
VSRHFNDLDAVSETDSFDDFRQLVFSFQSSPNFCGRGAAAIDERRLKVASIAAAIGTKPTQ